MRADEAAFEVGVNHARCLRCGVANVDGPRAHFFHACGEVGLQTEQGVAGANHAVQAGFVHAHVFEEDVFFVVIQTGDFGFDRGAHGHDRCVFFFRVGLNGCQVRVVFKAVLQYVGHVHGWFGGDEAVRLEQREFFFVQIQAANRFGFVQCRDDFFEYAHEFRGVFVTRARGFLLALQGFFGGG